MMTRHAVHCGFEHYLSGGLDTADRAKTLSHLDECEACWARWNRFRWQRAESHPLLAEPTAYLAARGHRFPPGRNSSRELAATWRSHSAVGASRRDFFSTSTAYLHNLVIWEVSGNRPDCAAHAHALLDAHETVMALRRGISSDTIALCELGHCVQLAAYLCPSTDFARWCFRQGGRANELNITELGGPLPQYDVIWSFDALDHIPDLHSQLGGVLTAARGVVTENPAVGCTHGQHGNYICVRPSVDELDHTFADYGQLPRPVAAADLPVRTWIRRSRAATPLRADTGSRS